VVARNLLLFSIVCSELNNSDIEIFIDFVELNAVVLSENKFYTMELKTVLLNSNVDSKVYFSLFDFIFVKL
jgi:hypothetical protein